VSDPDVPPISLVSRTHWGQALNALAVIAALAPQSERVDLPREAWDDLSPLGWQCITAVPQPSGRVRPMNLGHAVESDRFPDSVTPWTLYGARRTVPARSHCMH
jgi:hypothetical protein